MRAPRWSVLAVALALVSCREPPVTEPDPDVLAKVGPLTITVEEFERHLARRGGARAGRAEAEALLEEMIDLEVLHVEALRMGLDQTPETRRAWRNLLIGKLREQAIQPRLEGIRVEPEEIAVYYETNRSRYEKPARVRLAVLFRATDATTQREAFDQLKLELAEAGSRASALPAAGGFGRLAIDNSEHQSTRYRGGDVGWLEEGRAHAWLSSEIVDTAFALEEPGDVSAVLADSNGLYLLRLIDRREGRVVPLAEVEEQIRYELLREKRAMIERAFLAEARQSLRIESYPDRLKIPTAEIGGGTKPRGVPPTSLSGEEPSRGTRPNERKSNSE